MPSELSSPNNTTGLQSSIRGLHATPTAPLPYLDGVVVRSFVLERAQGNIIIYNSPGITAAKNDILALGRTDRLLVNHWHEAMYGAPDLDVPIFVHADDRRRTDLPIAGTFSERRKITEDLEVIPTPGHTAGATTFLWDNGEHRFLFSGDTVWVQNSEWKAVLLDEDARDAYIDSVLQLMGLSFDFVVPWGSEEGQPYGYWSTRAEAEQKLGKIIDRLRRGENA
ncbi:MBL fold metallo-hydrolase [Stakelama tenebrarum]|uniref:MBL fold metallo-hydrolase n=1 Tax=Stakelama tenebrarum TaxID=2711215 RepID=A0A6G6Y111_9SPHN|nr:MBL fold metallo-hydrolase [Sphingosinithalassobacter tenebrarum]QIG78612.1 MBL fold metallo-hydrolase [Sphingosinithalassobacter tenebrarum]